MNHDAPVKLQVSLPRGATVTWTPPLTVQCAWNAYPWPVWTEAPPYAVFEDGHRRMVLACQDADCVVHASMKFECRPYQLQDAVFNRFVPSLLAILFSFLALVYLASAAA